MPVLFLAQVSGTSALSATAIVAIITLAEAAGASLAHRFPCTGARGQWVLLLAALTVLLAVVPVTMAIAVAAVALSFVSGLSEPLRADLLQRAADDRVRARMASFASACDMACSSLLLLIVGAWRVRRR